VERQIAADLRVRDKTSLIGEKWLDFGTRSDFRYIVVARDPEAEALNQSDPTDHVLAAIASLLDHPESRSGPEKPVIEDMPVGPERSGAEGYCKFGPGPMPAIRFKWSVRREQGGEYYVDETIGEHSAPVITGPMSGDEAVKFVDDRESDVRQRFETLRNEMSGGTAARQLRNQSGEV
jgi:hypothetical protein